MRAARVRVTWPVVSVDTRADDNSGPARTMTFFSTAYLLPDRADGQSGQVAQEYTRQAGRKPAVGRHTASQCRQARACQGAGRAGGAVHIADPRFTDEVLLLCCFPGQARRLHHSPLSDFLSCWVRRSTQRVCYRAGRGTQQPASWNTPDPEPTPPHAARATADCAPAHAVSASGS
eukprot:COSAG01_NODE_94_length_26962_cov_9.110933_31_plen_176_part_00